MANHWQDAATESRTSYARTEAARRDDAEYARLRHARLTAERNASRYTLPVR